MFSDIELLREMLRSVPGHAWIPEDGTKLFLLLPDNYTILCILGEDLRSKSEEELNRIIQIHLLELKYQQS